MARYRDYPDIVTDGKRSVLPPALQDAVSLLSQAIAEGKSAEAHLPAYSAELEALPAASIIRAADEIQTIGGLFSAQDIGGGFWTLSRSRRPATRTAQLKALSATPGLSRLFVFHADGHLREAALKLWTDPPGHPFAFAALTYRLNDWVPQVREAARACAEEQFPRTSARVIAEASFFLLPQYRRLGRWGTRGRDVLEAALYRPDVTSELAFLLMQRPAGPVAQVLRQALRRPGLDAALPKLALDAELPHVRAIALETLLLRRASWTVGYRFEWTDKSFGRGRHVPVFEDRTVEHDLDVEQLVLQGARDRAVAVRKVAARGLIRLRDSLPPEMTEVGRLLAKDTAQSVRSLAEYFLKKVANE